MARGDGQPTIGRIAEQARRRLDELDPIGETRFASTTPGCEIGGPHEARRHAMHPCEALANVID